MITHQLNGLIRSVPIFYAYILSFNNKRNSFLSLLISLNDKYVCVLRTYYSSENNTHIKMIMISKKSRIKDIFVDLTLYNQNLINFLSNISVYFDQYATHHLLIRFLVYKKKGQLSRENLCLYANDPNRQRQTLVVTAGI